MTRTHADDDGRGTRRGGVAPLLVRAETAARMLGVSLRTFYRLESEGVVNGRWVTPRLKRYSVRDLRAVVAAAPTAEKVVSPLTTS
jgi:hypothetical protein